MEKILEQLKAVPIFSNSVQQTKARVSGKRWDDLDQPYVWQLVEECEGHQVYLDSGYGWLAHFCNGKLLGYGKDTICNSRGYDNFMVINREYYGVPKYLWRTMGV